MLIKDKDILAQNDTSSIDAPQAPAPRGIAKEHMREAWGDAFDYYLRGITSGYLKFRGRATRLEFWGYAVVASLLYLPLYGFGQFAEMPMLPYYYALATLIPSFAVMSRRLHDINKRSALYLAVMAGLLIFMFIAPVYAILPLIIWSIILIRLLSRPTYTEEGLYGDANEDDEIYGSDNEPIIAKFRLLAIMMSCIWLIMTGVVFDNWSRQAEYKGTRNQILEEVEAMAEKEQLSAEQTELAKKMMEELFKQLQGTAISNERKQELILRAVEQAKNSLN